MARRYKRDAIGRFAGGGGGGTKSGGSSSSTAKPAAKKPAAVKVKAAKLTTAKAKPAAKAPTTGAPKPKSNDGVLGSSGRTLGGSKNTIVKQRVTAFDDPYSPQAQASKPARDKRLERVASTLERGSFGSRSTESYRVRNGKSTAIEALRDAKDPRVGLISAETNKGQATGFLSYKPGRRNIEIVHLGTDGRQKGAGASLMRGALEVAARQNKGVVVSSSPEAVGFYKKMGLKDMGSGVDFALSAAEVKALLKRK